MRMTKFVWLMVLLLAIPTVFAKTATLPADAGAGGNNPFSSCSINGTQVIATTTYTIVDCPGDIVLFNGNGNFVDFTTPTILNVTGTFDLSGTDINVGGEPADVYINIGGDLVTGNSGNDVFAIVDVSGSILAENNTNFAGDLNITGDIALGNGSSIVGNVNVDGNLSTGENVTVVGNVTAEDITLGQNNSITGDVTGDDIVIGGGNTVVTGTVTGTGNVTNEGTVDGDVIVNCSDAEGETFVNDGAITGNVNSGCISDNNGTIDGYINAPDGSDYGDSGTSCDFGVNEVDPCGTGGTNVDYYEISHDGQGLTCTPETITLTACADASCSSLSNITGAYDLIASDGLKTYTVSGSFDGSGVATIALPVPVASTYTLSVNAVDTPSNPTQCDLAGVNDCGISFVDTAFLLSAPAAAQAGVSFDLTVQAIRTDNNTGACVAALDGAQDIGLGMTCSNPASCLQNATTGGVTLTEAPTLATVSTTFSGGIATIPITYPDAGAITFTASKAVPTGATLTGTLSTATVVRPFAFVVSTEAAADASAFSADYTAAPLYKMAGELFPVAVTAVNAQGNVTPNYGNETPQQRPLIASVPDYVAPTGSGGTVTLDSNLVFAGSGTGQFSSNAVRYSDIGVIRLLVNHTGGAYLSSLDVTGTSVPLGRFYPAYFSASEVVVPTFSHAQDDLTYLGQPLVYADFPQLTFAPKSVQGTTVSNYRDGFFNYSVDWSNRSYSHSLLCDGAGPYTLSGFGADLAQLNPNNDTDAIAEFVVSLPTDTGLIYDQDYAQLDNPFQSCAVLTIPAAQLTDSDGVCVKANAAGACQDYSFSPIEGTELLDGRLKLQSVFGPTGEPLELDFTIEYVSGGGFIPNNRDNSTLYSSSWTTPEASRFVNFVSSDGLTAARLDAQPLAPTPVVAGLRDINAPLLLDQTGAGNRTGTFDWIVNLQDVGLPWLGFAWTEECSPALNPELNPCAPLQFGVYRGNDRIIYQRELGW